MEDTQSVQFGRCGLAARALGVTFLIHFASNVLMQFVIWTIMAVASYPHNSTHMPKSRLINIPVSANTHLRQLHRASSRTASWRNCGFSHGGENDLRRARIPLGTALHERPTPTFPFSLMSSRICTLATVEQVVQAANDNEPKLARFLPTEWSGGHI